MTQFMLHQALLREIKEKVKALRSMNDADITIEFVDMSIGRTPTIRVIIAITTENTDRLGNLFTNIKSLIDNISLPRGATFRDNGDFLKYIVENPRKSEKIFCNLVGWSVCIDYTFPFGDLPDDLQKMWREVIHDTHNHDDSVERSFKLSGLAGAFKYALGVGPLHQA